MPARRKTKQSARPDDDIARDIRNALRLDNDVADERISIQVQSGSVTLEGNVEAALQREVAEADAKRVRGVVGVVNRILVEPAIASPTAR
jgi:osmotically-inducible protein OsmY